MDLKLDFDPKLFDPQKEPRITAPKRTSPQEKVPQTGSVYVYSADIVLAVNAALATQRPLLVMGPPGTGKSSLAQHIALHLGWRFYQKVITSRTQAQDLLWTFDALRRLRDAQTKTGIKTDAAYVQPQLLWWALNPSSAKRRGPLRPPRSRSRRIPLARPLSPTRWSCWTRSTRRIRTFPMIFWALWGMAPSK